MPPAVPNDQKTVLFEKLYLSLPFKYVYKKNYPRYPFTDHFSSIIQPQTTTATPAVKTDYLKKSKNQNPAAWILLGGGFAFATTGIIVGINGAAEEIIGAFSGEKSNTLEIGAGFFYTGLAAMLGSIPLFIASTRNKRKASAVSTFFKIEKRSFTQQARLVKSGYPAIALKINF